MPGSSPLADAVEALAAQAAAFEALLLIASAIHKAVRWSYLHNVVRQFAGVRPSLAPFVLAGVAAVELVAGGLLVLPGMRTIGAMLAASVWAAYLALIVRAIVQGRRETDCGCSFGPTRRSLGSYQVARASVLLILALFVLGSPVSAGAIHGSEAVAACALLALYAALDQVMALQPLRGGEVL